MGKPCIKIIYDDTNHTVEKITSGSFSSDAISLKSTKDDTLHNNKHTIRQV